VSDGARIQAITFSRDCIMTGKERQPANSASGSPSQSRGTREQFQEEIGILLIKGAQPLGYYVVSVTALDAYGHTAMGYRGTVRFNAPDLGASVVLPSPYRNGFRQRLIDEGVFPPA
jgi:hypothetical protein